MGITPIFKSRRTMAKSTPSQCKFRLILVSSNRRHNLCMRQHLTKLKASLYILSASQQLSPEKHNSMFFRRHLDGNGQGWSYFAEPASGALRVHSYSPVTPSQDQIIVSFALQKIYKNTRKTIFVMMIWLPRNHVLNKRLGNY